MVGRKAVQSREEEINEPRGSASPVPSLAPSSTNPLAGVPCCPSPVPGQGMTDGSPPLQVFQAGGASPHSEISPTHMCSRFKGIGALPPLTQVSVFNVEAKCTHFGGKLCRKILYISAEANGF